MRLIILSLFLPAAVVSLLVSPAFSSEQMSPPAPAEDIRTLIKALGGRWSTLEKYEPTFLTPKGGEGRGEVVFRPGPGGLTIEEEYYSKTPAGELFGFGLIWWDAKRNLQHLWCINVYPTGCEMFPPPPLPGPQWDGNRLVLHVETEQDGKKQVFHEVISEITPVSFLQTADVGEAGRPLARWFTTRATKITLGPGTLKK
ncbi:MAG TPA: hypothetical protein VMT15_01595 [Bryobacteraceae bacterium]|nr:hypothetical protein [Bryobacteraceae bacterium]